MTPDALGLFGPAAYSGPGPTGLLRSMSHRTRGEALAAELIVAACLIERPWPSVDGTGFVGGLRDVDARVDFGVKHLSHVSRRRTIESDLLISRGNTRYGVDVKRSASNYRHPPSVEVLAALSEAIQRGEVDSLHWVTPTRFRAHVRRASESHTGLHFHEGVWPSPEDQRRILLIESQAMDVNQHVREWQANPLNKYEDLAARLSEIAHAAYSRAWGPERDLRYVDLPDGFTYLFDTTDRPEPHPPARLVAAWGLSHQRTQSRQPSFMRRFPLPALAQNADRGHIIALSSGGAEGLGLNLVPQDRATNRGIGASGKRWRALERMAADHPGALIWRRLLYDAADYVPSQIESLVMTDRDAPILDRFINRSSVRTSGSLS
jgi:hypothetical protein